MPSGRKVQPIYHDDSYDESDDDTCLPSDTNDSDDDYPSNNYEHGGNVTPYICVDTPTGVYDHHNPCALDSEPPGDNQGRATTKEEEFIQGEEEVT